MQFPIIFLLLHNHSRIPLLYHHSFPHNHYQKMNQGQVAPHFSAFTSFIAIDSISANHGPSTLVETLMQSIVSRYIVP